MNPFLRLFIKTFLIMGMGFGILNLIVDLLSGQGFQLWAILYSSAFFGFFMSVAFVTLQFLFVKKLIPGALSDDMLNVNQKRIVQSGISRTELLNKLKTDSFFRKMELKEENSTITLTSSVNWMSWGENIQINIHQVTPHLQEFEIVSGPRLKTTLIDFGRNLKNVTWLEKLIAT